jgi:hypothetical protein
MTIPESEYSHIVSACADDETDHYHFNLRSRIHDSLRFHESESGDLVLELAARRMLRDGLTPAETQQVLASSVLKLNIELIKDKHSVLQIQSILSEYPDFDRDTDESVRMFLDGEQNIQTASLLTMYAVSFMNDSGFSLFDVNQLVETGLLQLIARRDSPSEA